MTFSDITPKFLTKPYTVGVVAAPFSGGQPKKGVDEGPKHLIENGLLNQLIELGWKIDESTVTSYEPMIPTAEDLKKGSHKVIKNAGYVARVCKDVAKQVETKCRSKSLALTLGGDHSIAMGTVSGTARVYPNVGVIWVDAHADINTTMTTVSGNLHGCPVSFLLGISGNLPEFEWCTPCIKPHQIVYIGLRDVEQGEKDLLKKHNIKAFSMHQVDKYGIGSVMEQSIAYLNEGSPDGNPVPIHLTFDVDALDPSVAPATGTPVRGGLSFREGHFICEIVWETGNLVSMDIMEVNPSLGSDEYSLQQTIQVGCSLVRASLGETLL